MKRAAAFVPHAHCPVTSGACFTAGECLRDCQPPAPPLTEERVRALVLEELVRLNVIVVRDVMD